MKKIFSIIYFVLFPIIVVWAQTSPKEIHKISQEPPGLIPEKFVPGTISVDNEYEF